MSRFDASLLDRALAYIGRPIPEAAPSASPPATAVEIAAALCERFEGFSAQPYLCPAGVPTIGYGATHYLDGRAVKLKDPPLSREAARRLLEVMIQREYLPAVLRLCPGVREAKRLAALIDFTFNLGAGNLRASTLRRRVNEDRWDEVPAELMKWTRAAGKVLRGLVLRREAEAALILTAVLPPQRSAPAP